ncbi:MAG: tRNA-(ms[2]io[6]A)-hydroxylase [Cellvibrionaceae bacterium]|nr:tRNA-(ms[2]io[6]A)-hydroxylase [Cellvibrionaceae bacterium]
MSDTFEPRLQLRYNTPAQWTQTVLAAFNDFLIDHAQAEKKASGMAVSMLSHYPDKPVLVNAMADLAIEELAHFREVIKLMQARQLQLTADEKDPYVNQIRQHMRRGKADYMLDRLLSAAIIEARGCERFGLIGDAHPDAKIQDFYQQIAASEAQHHRLFINLAGEYFPQPTIAARLDALLDIEADICRTLPLRAALH